MGDDEEEFRPIIEYRPRDVPTERVEPPPAPPPVAPKPRKRYARRPRWRIKRRRKPRPPRPPRKPLTPRQRGAISALLGAFVPFAFFASDPVRDFLARPEVTGAWNKEVLPRLDAVAKWATSKPVAPSPRPTPRPGTLVAVTVPVPTELPIVFTPAPQGAPEPTPKPEPTPEPEPTREPEPDPTPEPEPTPTAAPPTPGPTVAPTPTAAPPTPRPTLTPAPAARPSTLASARAPALSPAPGPRPATPATSRPPERRPAQVARRMRVPMPQVAPTTWRHRTPDGFAQLQLELLPDGGAQLQAVADLRGLRENPAMRGRLRPVADAEGGPTTAFAEDLQADPGWWLRRRPGFKLLDAFMARYIPEAGATSDARLAWWGNRLADRARAAAMPVEGGRAWTPTFNVGDRRLGQAVLDGQAFGLVLYAPPEDAGL